MKRHRALGGKSLAQKVRSEMKRWPPGATEELRRELTSHVQECRTRLRHSSEFTDPRDLEDFVDYASAMAALQAVVGALEETPTIGKIAHEIERLEDEYMPGGPPMSPIHDTLFMTWSTLDLRFGRGRDTVATLALDLAPKIGIDDRARATIDAMARSRLGLFRVLSEYAPTVGESPVYVVRELVTERELRLQFIERYDLHAGELLLIRPLEVSAPAARQRQVSHVVVSTPYHLEGTDPAWTDYLERQAAESKRRLDADVYDAIMRSADRPRRWLDFIMDGYAGTRANNAVVVTGIPDRPETLPHHDGYDAAAEHAIAPGTPDRERATLLSARFARFAAEALHEQPQAYLDALGARFEALARRGADPSPWHAMVMPVVFYQVGATGGAPLVDALRAADALDPDESEYATAARAGVTSIFEVVAVERGVGMRLRDLLGDGEYEVRERSGTLHMPTRALLMCRVVTYRGIGLLDGSVPVPGHPRIRAELVDALRKRIGKRGRSKHPLSGEAVFEAMLIWQEVTETDRRRQAEAPPPTIVTTSGDPIAFTKIALGFDPKRRADVLDAIARLRGAIPDTDDDTAEPLTHFDIVTRGTLEARLELFDDRIEVESNAERRARNVVARLRKHLPGALRQLAKTVESVDDLRARAVPKVREPPSPEHHEVIRMVLQQHYATFLDQPIPALSGKTPRAAAKDPALRPALETLLREHEFNVTMQHGEGLIDFDALRRQVGLKH